MTCNPPASLFLQYIFPLTITFPFLAIVATPARGPRPPSHLMISSAGGVSRRSLGSVPSIALQQETNRLYLVKDAQRIVRRCVDTRYVQRDSINLNKFRGFTSIARTCLGGYFEDIDCDIVTREKTNLRLAACDLGGWCVAFGKPYRPAHVLLSKYLGEA